MLKETNNEEELLILDDTENENNDLLELGDIIIESNEDDQDINLDENTLLLDATELDDDLGVKLTDYNEKTPDISLDSELLLSNDVKEETNNLLMDKTDEALLISDDNIGENTGLDLSTDSGNDSMFENSNIEEDEGELITMEGILSKAINDLKGKSDSNKDEINSEKEYNKGLKEQIDNLVAQVSISDEKVVTLNLEQTVISKNIKSLDRMKKEDIAIDDKHKKLSKTNISKAA